MKLIIVAVVSLLFLVGCSTTRWEIKQTMMGYHDDKNQVIEKKNAVLLDTLTGDTWMLWTDKDIGGPGKYIWKKLPKK